MHFGRYTWNLLTHSTSIIDLLHVPGTLDTGCVIGIARLNSCSLRAVLWAGQECGGAGGDGEG